MRGGVPDRLAPLPFLILLSVCAAACATLLQSDTDAPAGSLRLAVVASVNSREEVLSRPEVMADLKSAGIRDQDLRDGSLILTALHCCNGPDVDTYRYAYVPPGIQLRQGDLVEIRVARDPSGAGLDRINVVTQLREPAGTEPSSCAWLPLQAGLWRRAIYCDWMPAEGWTGVRNWLGQTEVWIKAAP
ncbi:MAG TPA: hypothetical protein VEN47_14880 [Myxococcota bacterium]|nr:hypothetical protein [Myxococcota bacterium]